MSRKKSNPWKKGSSPKRTMISDAEKAVLKTLTGEKSPAVVCVVAKPS